MSSIDYMNNKLIKELVEATLKAYSPSLLIDTILSRETANSRFSDM